MTKTTKRLTRTMVYLILLLASLIANLPILTMILNSFKSNSEILTSKSMLPVQWTLSNYQFVNEKSAFWHQFGNSIYVTAVSLLLTIVVGALAGYAISRFTTWISGTFSVLLLLLQMFPIILVLLPLFVTFRSLHLTNTLNSVVIIQTATHLPFAVLMFKSFFDTIPKEIEEAAWMDGCSRWSTFSRIVLPISGSGIAAVSIFSILFSWNDYLIANTFIKKESLMTVPIGLQLFMQQNSAEWGSLTAAATLSTLPILIFLFFVQKYMAYGSAAGSVKG
ncbi:carbohydrate ABC transporter permease [Paenibacillus sp. TC-CSREp1]|uniref:carbohydrate ABC transporter permease n=1 Tax=Paenibacillus sp. TC-CSREp1 TaxID=3410089 RepID=UPI003CED88E4